MSNEKNIILNMLWIIHNWLYILYISYLMSTKISGREAVAHRENSGERRSKEFGHIEYYYVRLEIKILL